MATEQKHAKLVLAIGIFAMALLVIGTFISGGSLLQKILFVVGASVLGAVAYFNKQKMFTVLQTVATIGAVLAFTNLASAFRYGIMLSVAVGGVVYLVKHKQYKEDPWSTIASLGLVLFAIGLATNPVLLPIVWSLAFMFGGILVASYSAVGFFKHKIKIAAIWLILNLLLTVNPIRLLLG
jgi:hypothetical protein